MLQFEENSKSWEEFEWHSISFVIIFSFHNVLNKTFDTHSAKLRSILMGNQ